MILINDEVKRTSNSIQTRFYLNQTIYDQNNTVTSINLRKMSLNATWKHHKNVLF